MKALLQHCLLGIGLLSLSSFSYADRQIVDQIGRTVTIPDKVERTVVLQHQTLNLLVQLDATDKIVGVMSNWKQQLGDGYAQLAPSLEKTPKVGDLTSFDAESLVKLQPQVVFVTNYAPNKISALGIPVVAISLRKEVNDDKSTLNPTLQNEEQAYNEGLKEGILLIGDIVNKSENAQALVNDTFKQREQVSQRLQNVPKEQRVRAYMANPDLTTYGSGKYTGLMMEHAGAFNVAASTVKGYKQVSLEQVIAWDPEVIFIQDRYPQVVDEIKQDARWQVISAVKNNRIYLMPEYAKAWGYPMPEAMAIGELWMAKKIYPEKFSDIDMQKAANDWYKKFYRTQYQGKE
ncbi:ABC transporter substrate-binding protein [Proteus terrae]|uniref:ABC transporter substrate-binding protein n=1 Tax=Proteus terrae TaxID=1574161 RepID=UPI002DD42190|nr:ABC transporter substrate-binding protein [Proteus terrae]